MSEELIYKTTSPEALAWYRDYLDRFEQVRSQEREFQIAVNEVIPPWPGDDQRNLVSIRGRLVGVTYTSAENLARKWGNRSNLPEGWRIKREWDRVLVPNKTTKAGKEWQARMDALPSIFIRSDIEKHLGVPEHINPQDSHRLYSPGFSTDEDDQGQTTALYVMWGSGRCAEDFEKDTKKVAPSVEWEEIPRSQWYARQEALDAKKENA